MNDGPLQIDLKKILRARIPENKQRWIPNALISGLERLIHQEDLNAILRATYPKTGSEFAQGVLDHLGINLEIKGMEKIPAEGRFIFVSNHPLGGLDGIALISVLGKRYGDDNVRFLVNDMLMNVEPLKTVFLPINKYGSQAREAAKVINECYDSERQMLIFPAGLVSRLSQNGEIKDLDWQKAFVIKAIQSRRDLIPVRFEGLNSMKFYRTAYWRKKLGLKVNIEQALLPGELCKAAGSNYRITFGKPINYQQLAQSKATPAEKARAIKKIVYSL